MKIVLSNDYTLMIKYTFFRFPSLVLFVIFCLLLQIYYSIFFQNLTSISMDDLLNTIIDRLGFLALVAYYIKLCYYSWSYEP